MFFKTSKITENNYLVITSLIAMVYLHQQDVLLLLLDKSIVQKFAILSDKSDEYNDYIEWEMFHHFQGRNGSVDFSRVIKRGDMIVLEMQGNSCHCDTRRFIHYFVQQRPAMYAVSTLPACDNDLF